MCSHFYSRHLSCHVLAVIILAIPLFSVGCSRAVKEIPNSNQNLDNQQFSAPSETLNELRISLVNKNETLFLQCFRGPDSYHKCLHEIFRHFQSTIRFKDELEKMYGPGAWYQYQQSSEKLTPQPKLTLKIIPVSEEWWRKLQIQQQGDKALFYDPFTEMTNVMSNVDGEWKIEVKSIFSQDVDEKKLADFLKTETDAIEEFSAELPAQKPPIDEIGVKLFQKVSGK